MADSSEKIDNIFKVIVVGDRYVGKTSIINRYVNNNFNINNLVTIGFDAFIKDIKLQNGKIMTVRITDTAGQENYRCLTKSFFRNTDGVILVFSLNSKQTFENIGMWMDNFCENANKNNTPVFLVGNKKDLIQLVEDNLIFDYALKNKFILRKVSAIDNSDGEIERVFEDLAQKMYENDEKTKENHNQQHLKKLRNAKKKEKQTCCIGNYDDY